MIMKESTIMKCLWLIGVFIVGTNCHNPFDLREMPSSYIGSFLISLATYRLIKYGRSYE